MTQLANSARYAGLPGWEFVGPGLEDLAAGRETVAGSLVAMATRRLRRLGVAVSVPDGASSPGDLYLLVVADVGARKAHARYNALRRRLASFLGALGSTVSTDVPDAEAHARDG